MRWSIADYNLWLTTGCPVNNEVEELDLYDCGLTYIPSKIENLTRLQVIGASRNRISSLPSSIGNLKHLRKLAFENNKLTFLPAEIGSLIGLEMLGLSRNKLAALPLKIANLTSLKYLWLNDNRLDTFTFNLPALCLLWIDNNNIKSVSNKFKSLDSFVCDTDCVFERGVDRRMVG